MNEGKGMMPQQNLCQLVEPTDQRWLDLISSRKESNIFHHPDWMLTLAECYGYRPFIITVSDERNNIAAGIPMMEVNSFLTGRRWISLPYTDHCCPLYQDEASLDRLISTLQSAFADGMIPKVELRWDYSKNLAFSTQSDFLLHTLTLDKNADRNLANVTKSFRQCIKQAQKKGVRIEWGEEDEQFQQFYQQMLSTRRGHGVPVQPQKFFDYLRANVLNKGHGYLLCAYKGDVFLASLLVLHWHHTLTIKYSCSGIPKSDLQMRPNHLLYWTAICWAAENGFSFVDMGRCSNSNDGLRAFKRRWGVQERTLRYSYLSSDNNKGLQQGHPMTIMQTVIRKSPTFVCRLTGELLYKHFA